jgi:PAS domain S-box-containing protein
MIGRTIQPYDVTFTSKSGVKRIGKIQGTLLRDEHNKVIGDLVMISDVTQSVQTTEEIKLLQQAIEQSPSTIVVTDKEGTIEYVNPKFTEITGYTSEEAFGRNPRILKSGRQSPLFYQELWDTISAGKEWRGEFCNKKKNGEEYWESASISPVKGEDGEVSHYMAIKEDITAKRKIEDAFRYRIRFEDLIMTISTYFINLAPAETDNDIVHALQSIAEFAGVDRSYIFLLSDDRATISNTYEWCSTGIDEQAEALQNIKVEQVAWWMKQLDTADGIHIPQVKDMNAEATAEKNILMREEVKSVMAVPLVFRNKTIGFLGFDAVREERVWSEQHITLLKMVADIFASTITRQKDDAALKRRECILEAVSFASERFMQSASWQEQIQSTLQHLGEAEEVSRVYIFQNHQDKESDLVMSQLYEWVGTGIEPEINNPLLQNVSYEQNGFGAWITKLRNGEAIGVVVKDLPAAAQHHLVPQAIRSLLVVPIFVEGNWWGFIGFDDCTSERIWSAIEIDALRTAAGILGSAIERDQAAHTLQGAYQRLADKSTDMERLNKVLVGRELRMIQLKDEIEKLRERCKDTTSAPAHESEVDDHPITPQDVNADTAVTAAVVHSG